MLLAAKGGCREAPGGDGDSGRKRGRAMRDATGRSERDGAEAPKGTLAQEEMRKTIGRALVPFRWDLLGFGLCRAQATALLAFAANEIWISGASFAVQEVVFALAAATALAIAIFAKRRAGLAAPVGAVVAFLTVGVLGVVSIMIGKFDGSGVLLVAGFSLAGASAGFFETAWGPKFVRLSQAGIQLYTLFAMAVSSLFGIMLSLLPGNGFYLASLALLGVQAVLLLVRRDADEAAEEEEGGEGSAPAAGAAAATATAALGVTPSARVAQPDRGPARTVLAILATTLAFSLIYNMFITLAYSSLPSDAASQIRFWANLLAACVIICSFLLLRPVRPATLFHLVLPVVTLGFVLFLLSPGLLGEGALMASSIGRKFFDIFVWIIVAEAASLPGIGAWRSFGLLTAAKNFGYGVGLLAAHAALAAVDADIVQVAAIVAVLILGLVVLLSWLFPERMLSRLFRTAPVPAAPVAPESESAFEASIARVAERGRLTPRECEVMGLLARGRNIPAIAEKLCISKGTAHTHAAHVYQKLDVHRQQELIELVEREKTESVSPDQVGD